MKLLKLFSILFCFSVCLIACTNEADYSADIVASIYSPDTIPSQTFRINNDVDNIIEGSQGTKIRIPRNSFADSNGKVISGMVDLDVKEVFSIEDRILGNLTTTSNGKALETGGMMFLGAKQQGIELRLAENKEISLAVPTDSIMPHMSFYSGVPKEGGLDWVNPIPIADSLNAKRDSVSAFDKTTNIMYSVDGFMDADLAPDSVNQEVGRIAWEGDGLKISKDSTLKIGKDTVRFFKQNELQRISDPVIVQPGVNNFNEDKNLYYVFSIKNLGWANIDRLLEDPRTKEVEFDVNLPEYKSYDRIYITLATQNMYLPGYQKKDKSFSFSHDDAEPQQLPIGEKATIIATAYKGDIPHFQIYKVVIEDKQKISLSLKLSTLQELKSQIQKQL